MCLKLCNMSIRLILNASINVQYTGWFTWCSNRYCILWVCTLSIITVTCIQVTLEDLWRPMSDRCVSLLLLLGILPASLHAILEVPYTSNKLFIVMEITTIVEWHICFNIIERALTNEVIVRNYVGITYCLQTWSDWKNNNPETPHKASQYS